jgi:protein-disulfide isomerase
MANRERDERKTKLREERLREEAAAQASERRQRLLKLGAAAVFGAILIVAAAILVSQSGSDSGGGNAGDIRDAGLVNGQLEGIPQDGLVLGEPGVRTRVIEFGDLQCPVCKEYSETVIPKLIAGPVRQGKAKLEFRNYLIIGPQSVAAGAAAIAAGRQGKGWNYVELFYRNQGVENSGYADDAFLEAVARAAGVPDIARWNSDRKSPAVKKEMKQTSDQAVSFGFNGTPSFMVTGPNGTKALGTPGLSAAPFEAAISQVG